MRRFSPCKFPFVDFQITGRSDHTHARSSEQEFKCLAEYYAFARSSVVNESREAEIAEAPSAERRV